MRQPNKRAKSSNHQKLHLEAELSHAREVIARLKAETTYLRKQLAQYQSAEAPSPNNPQNSSKATHLRSPQQQPSSKRQPPSSPNWEQPKAAKRRVTASNAAQSRLRQRSRRSQRPPRVLRRVVSGAIALIGTAVLVGTTLSLRQPNAKNVGNQPIATKPVPPLKPTVPPPAFINGELVYNVRTPPNLEASPDLKGVVDSAVAVAASKGFETSDLSITLIDLKTNKVAAHQGQTLRYPASVAKFFWMVMAFAQIEQGILKPDPTFDSDMKAMAVVSDNDAASRVVDRISQATSGAALSGAEFTSWMEKRFRVNNFFNRSGFEGLSVVLKNYPVYSLKMESPTGREAQLLGQTVSSQPARNRASTDQSARVMYDLYNHLTVSEKHSDEMIALLKRDLHPEVWKKDPLNCVAGFLGEYLPPNTIFAGKIGYTSKTRHEVAFVETPDHQTAYVLAVFGEAPQYSNSGSILPEISKHIYLKMTGKNPQPQASPINSPSPEAQI